MRTKRENGVALITALLILFLVSAIVVGMSWMVVSDQRLSGNNQDRELAFYGAEAGMEKMTADMGNTFARQWFDRCRRTCRLLPVRLRQSRASIHK